MFEGDGDGKKRSDSQRIPHRTCQKGVTARWHISNGQPTAQSICWLFCWAATGQGSDEAMQEARRAFDEIFDQSYDWLNCRPRFNLHRARQLRYKKKNIENEFRSYLR